MPSNLTAAVTGGSFRQHLSNESHTGRSLGHCTYDPVPVQVLAPSGAWVSGYRLAATLPDGLALICSDRTGQTRALAPDRWRDPLEAQALATLAKGAGQ